jgi:hypothetical protein
MFPIALAGLSLGFLGSFHCIGMCGPIALALPNDAQSSRNVFRHLAYNVGRIVTYTLLGLLFGFIGKGLFIGGVQQIISIALGSIILLLVFFPAIMPSRLRSFSLFQLPGFKKLFSLLATMKTVPGFFSLGILNGLLPCGFVYMALSAAVLSTQPSEGAMFMAMFGLGTVPAMLSLGLMAQAFSIKSRNLVRKTIPYIAATMGLILILRGLNLGIPYVSPKMTQESAEIKVDCCKK